MDDDYGYDADDYGYGMDGCPECGGQQGYHRDACDTGALDEDLEGGPFWTSRLLEERERELEEANRELVRCQKREGELSRLLGKRERELVRLEAIWPFYCFLACLVGIVIGMGIMAVVAG